MMTKKEASNRLFLLRAKAVSTLDEKALDMAIKALEQTRPKGKWTQKTGSRALWCSVCEDCIHEEIPYAFDYCPNCGADMRGDTE